MNETFKVDPGFLTAKNLTIGEYYVLMRLNLGFKVQSFKTDPIYSPINFKALEQKGYIKIVETGVILRTSGKDLFVTGDEIFNKIFTHFPIKTPSGRPLSATGLDTKQAEEMKKKWKKIFKNDIAGERKALAVLDAEIEFRKKNNKMEFMHNIEAWINQRDFEKHEFMLEENTKSSLFDQNELM